MSQHPKQALFIKARNNKPMTLSTLCYTKNIRYLIKEQYIMTTILQKHRTLIQPKHSQILCKKSLKQKPCQIYYKFNWRIVKNTTTEV